jgi:ribonucleoside-diphosphate reductase beta chain
MSLIDGRSYYKPFEYPWAFEAYQQQQKMHWLPDEIQLADDVKDWNTVIDPKSRNLLRHILRFFTQSDVDVSEGYTDKLLRVFGKHPEVRMMLVAFANMESVHAHAYSLLLDTVGMPEFEYKAFANFKETLEKHTYLAQFSVENPRRVALALAQYSAFIEGVQLFSSFAILLNFCRFGRMNGMGQIISYSIKDESLHVASNTRLFNTYIAENLWLWSPSLKEEIIECGQKTVDLEDNFIDLAFEHGGVYELTPEILKKFIRYLADRRLIGLGIKGIYNQRENPLPWLDWVVNGAEHANFFETRPTAYGKANTSGKWSDVFPVKEVA